MSLKHYHHPATSTGQKIASPKKYLTASKLKYVCRVYMHIFYVLFIIKDIYIQQKIHVLLKEKEKSEPRMEHSSDTLIIKVTLVAAAEHQI